MTTVCYKDGVLAADSMVSQAGTVAGRAEKLYEIQDGSVVAFCGSLALGPQFVQWVRKGCPEKSKPQSDDKDFDAMRVFPDGNVVWYAGDYAAYSFDMHRGFVAIGSGSQFAMGAMAAGATAEEACKLACEFDLYSSEPVITMETKGKQMPKGMGYGKGSKKPMGKGGRKKPGGKKK